MKQRQCLSLYNKVNSKNIHSLATNICTEIKANKLEGIVFKPSSHLSSSQRIERLATHKITKASFLTSIGWP